MRSTKWDKLLAWRPLIIPSTNLNFRLPLLPNDFSLFNLVVREGVDKMIFTPLDKKEEQEGSEKNELSKSRR